MKCEEAAVKLLQCLDQAVAKHLALSNDVGAWLSGGLDSSSIAALARTQSPQVHTFSAGLRGAPDPEYARLVAAFIDSEHHELEVSPEGILTVLPDVIYHLESFDALLVRSSIMNYLVGKLASDYVPTVFSGEGGDEMLAGYEYLKSIEQSDLPEELVDITNRLHNTALQRVDRCSAAHGLTVCAPFLDREVVETALRIPPEYKLWRNGTVVGKWVLRQAMSGLLPDVVINRPKAKFWEGSGITDMLKMYADDLISDADFRSERALPDGSRLISKEELMYYRVFREHFGGLTDLSFVGRTKGAD
jgi:asparagine synthase (glutamine-hydrolysing)